MYVKNSLLFGEHHCMHDAGKIQRSRIRDVRGSMHFLLYKWMRPPWHTCLTCVHVFCSWKVPSQLAVKQQQQQQQQQQQHQQHKIHCIPRDGRKCIPAFQRSEITEAGWSLRVSCAKEERLLRSRQDTLDCANWCSPGNPINADQSCILLAGNASARMVGWATITIDETCLLEAASALCGDHCVDLSGKRRLKALVHLV